MKLDNHGWGTKEFIFSIVAMLFLLLIVIVNVHSLYNAIDETGDNTESKVTEKNNKENNNSIDDKVNDNSANNTLDDNNVNSDNSTNNSESEPVTVTYNESYYTSYQNKMIDATRSYIINASLSVPSNGARVDLKTLTDKNYIEPLNDLLDGSLCSGYSVVSLSGDSRLNIRTYLKCSNYETEGY